MKRTILITVLGSMLAVAGLALGSDTASRAADRNCPFPCGSCPLPCAAQNAAAATDGGCSSSCSYATAN
jgi:hypothetical protein